MMLKKRGIAPVIATVLLVLLTITAVSILAAFIVPFVRDNLQKSTQCVSYREYFSFEGSFGYNCFDNQGRNAVSVKSNTASGMVSEKVDGFDLVFIGGGEGKKVSIRNGQSACEGSTRFLGMPACPDSAILQVPEPGEIMTFIYQAGNKTYSDVEIYPVLKTGTICEKTDSIKIIPCKPEVSLQ